MLLRLYTEVQSAWFDIRARWREERGAVATEYALLLVLIALVIAAGIAALGATLLGVFNDADACLQGIPC